MRPSKIAILVVLSVVGLTGLAVAGQNKFGVADNRSLTLTAPTRVGDVLLPQGVYQVVHTMEGEEHVMVFKQANKREPVEVRVKCKLAPLGQKATRDEQGYSLNAANERVLHRLIFRGDSAEHVF